MNVTIIQPPLVQLNTAYPSGAYLSAYFKGQNCNVKWHDLSVELFYAIFSQSGLTELFAISSSKALSMADKAEKKEDESTAFELRRYVSQSSRWISWIDQITAILRDGSSVSGRELCHRFLFSPYAPRGHRMDNFLENLDHEPTIDDARFLACMAIADLGDYITAVFDSEFSLIRYAEALTVNETSFSEIEKGVDSPVLKTFYEPILEKYFGKETEFEKEINQSKAAGERQLILISLPFAGTFTAGLSTGRWLKQHYGKSVFISMGGGFVNTELRETTDRALCRYTDALSYDRGYGSYKALFNCCFDTHARIYKMRFFNEDGVTEPLSEDKEMQHFENLQTSSLIPDYSDIDFSRYPRMTDDVNPMHRLWSDGTWIKAYLAHGCYWHKCDFCDVTLDYVSGYRLTSIESLYKGLVSQARKHGVYGIHFVDEALPPAALKDFAKLNAADKNQLSYWGNVRFEKTFSHDLAAFLSYGGLIGVSAGIEIATGSGLDEIHKGTDLDSIVAACCAFKEAGILVHAYMIYGYWMEDDQALINSMETLRQFYAAGLLDSSFWHKFVLTRHSRVYSEWQKGLHPELKPIEPENAGLFAKNGLHFAGEKKSEKFGAGLDAALEAWMHGEGLNKNVQKWFNFPVPRPTIAPDYLEKAIERYESRKSSEAKTPLNLERMYWLGGEPFASKGKLQFINLQEMSEVNFSLSEDKAKDFCSALYALRPEVHDVSLMEKMIADPAVEKLLYRLRKESLIQLPF